MNPMIDYIVGSRSFLPFIGCKSGPSAWLDGLSDATSPLKSRQSSESVTYLFEDFQIYGLIYPVQSLISERFFEELYQKKEDDKPDRLRLKKQNENVKIVEPSEINAIRKTNTGHGLNNGFLQAGLRTDISEFEKKLQTKLGTKQVQTDLRIREELLRDIINRYGKEIEHIYLGQGLRTLKQVLKYPDSTSIERLKRTEQDFFSITEEHSSSENFKKAIAERIMEKFSRYIEGISTSNKLLEEKSGRSAEQNQQAVASLNDYHTHNIKSLNSDKRLIEDKEFSKISERISEQFSRRIQGIPVSKKLLFNNSENTDGQDWNFSIDRTEHSTRDIESESNRVLLERISEQFDRTPILDLKILENKNKLDIISQTDSNMLIKQAYSNYESKTKVKEDTTEIFQDLIEKVGQVINQNNRSTAPSRQNIFNIHVSGNISTDEKDLQNLSDRLVLILKEQARRHGIDLS